MKTKKNNLETTHNIKEKDLPRHIAIIMDGNGRWAESHRLPRIKGHHEGASRVKEIVTCARNLGVEVLSLYVFSSENWRRPKDEVEILMELLYLFIEREFPLIMEKQVRLIISGEIDEIPSKPRNALLRSISETAHHKAMTLNLALNYGGRNEIVRACKLMIDDVIAGRITHTHINEELFSKYLYHPEIPDPDLVIRTSGELRISNFLLWEIAYSEFYITETLWPDFHEEEFFKSIADFQKRKRRFGGL